jgi:hypothetical protein
MHFLLKNSVNLKLAKNPNSSSGVLSPANANYKDIFYLTDKKIPTGLTKPYPEELSVIHNSHHNAYSGFLITEEQLSADFIQLEDIRVGDEITLLKDAKGSDNCYNQPAGVTVPKGTTLIAKEPQGTRCGDYFFKYNNNSVDLHDLYCPCPWAMPILTPNVATLKRAASSDT